MKNTINRRQFLNTVSASCITATSLSETLTAPATAASTAVKEPEAHLPYKAGKRKRLAAYTTADHRQRLENIAICEQDIESSLSKQLINNYLPGQAYYNLGEYPDTKPWQPSEYDDQELDRLQEHGIELIQVWLDWCDELRLFGGDKFNPANPKAFRQFVDKVHARGMKIIPYTSTGYFERRDPDFRPEWSRSKKQDLKELCWDWARCSYASPSWRAYLLPRLFRLMDDYGVDGLYNDMGYGQGVVENKFPATKDEVLAFNETDEDDGYLTDMLGTIYNEVNSRGGIIKIHRGGTQAPKSHLKVYDYLWVGEGGTNADRLREAVKAHSPYVVPCLDMSRASIEDENELYLHTVPYMQFPLLTAGRPFTGERAAIDGIEYTLDKNDFWSQHYLSIREHYKKYPNGPYSYSQWDSAIPRPNTRSAHARWLKQYLPLVEEGTWAWLELKNSNFFTAPLPEDVVASVFANRELFLILANYSTTPITVITREIYRPISQSTKEGSNKWQLPARSLHILQRQMSL